MIADLLAKPLQLRTLTEQVPLKSFQALYIDLTPVIHEHLTNETFTRTGRDWSVLQQDLSKLFQLLRTLPAKSRLYYRSIGPVYLHATETLIIDLIKKETAARGEKMNAAPVAKEDKKAQHLFEVVSCESWKAAARDRRNENIAESLLYTKCADALYSGEEVSTDLFWCSTERPYRSDISEVTVVVPSLLLEMLNVPHSCALRKLRALELLHQNSPWKQTMMGDLPPWSIDMSKLKSVFEGPELFTEEAVCQLVRGFPPSLCCTITRFLNLRVANLKDCSIDCDSNQQIVSQPGVEQLWMLLHPLRGVAAAESARSNRDLRAALPQLFSSLTSAKGTPVCVDAVAVDTLYVAAKQANISLLVLLSIFTGRVLQVLSQPQQQVLCFHLLPHDVEEHCDAVCLEDWERALQFFFTISDHFAFLASVGGNPSWKALLSTDQSFGLWNCSIFPEYSRRCLTTVLSPMSMQPQGSGNAVHIACAALDQCVSRAGLFVTDPNSQTS